MAAVVFEVMNRKQVTTETVSSFLEDLMAEGYIRDGDIEWVSYDHYDPDIQNRTGESFHPATARDAEQIVRDNGVEFLGIGFSYLSRYERHLEIKVGIDSRVNGLTAMVDDLNQITPVLAAEFAHDCVIDLYAGASLNNGRYYTEYVEGGFVEECKFSLAGDGDPGLYNLHDPDPYNERLRVLASERSERYRTFLKLMEKNFGDISVYVAVTEL